MVPRWFILSAAHTAHPIAARLAAAAPGNWIASRSGKPWSHSLQQRTSANPLETSQIPNQMHHPGPCHLEASRFHLPAHNQQTAPTHSCHHHGAQAYMTIGTPVTLTVPRFSKELLNTTKVTCDRHRDTRDSHGATIFQGVTKANRGYQHPETCFYRYLQTDKRVQCTRTTIDEETKTDETLHRLTNRAHRSG